MEQDKGTTQQRKLSFGQKWENARPTKTILFWSCVGCMVFTMIVGFVWGGWVTGGTARQIAEKTAEEAVVNRLAPMCVVQFTQDPGKDAKLKELKAASYWQKSEYIEKQGWATMLGEEKSDRKVADGCAKLLMKLSETTSSLQSTSRVFVY